MNSATDSAIQIDLLQSDLQMINDTLQSNHADICSKLEFLEDIENVYSVIIEYQSVISGILLFFTLCFVIWFVYKIFRIFF